jgi:AcrR family transcriptional regulator
LTTNAVAARAGVSIGSLYEYFADKQALVDALLDRHLDAAEAVVAAAGDPATDRELHEIVDAVVDGYAALHASDPALHRALSSQVPISGRHRARIAKIRDAAAGLVAEALRGHVGEPAVAARLMVDTADSLTHLWIAEEAARPERIEALLHSLRAMLVAYARAARA